MKQETKVQHKYDSCHKDQQPHDQGLFEILLEGPEKSPGRSIVISLYGTHHTMIKCSQCRSDSDHWDAA